LAGSELILDFYFCGSWLLAWENNQRDACWPFSKVPSLLPLSLSPPSWIGIPWRIYGKKGLVGCRNGRTTDAIVYRFASRRFH